MRLQASPKASRSLSNHVPEYLTCEQGTNRFSGLSASLLLSQSASGW